MHTFFKLNVWPPSKQPRIPDRYCLPKQVISTCMRKVIENQCGSSTAALVQDYLSQAQHWTAKAPKSAGPPSNICSNELSGYTSTRTKISLGVPGSLPHEKSHFDKLLEDMVPGSALDTIYFRSVLRAIRNVSGEELCSFTMSMPAYSACIMSSDDISYRNQFNVLQFAQNILAIEYHGTQCPRLEQFKTCWKVLKQICGSRVVGFEQHAKILVGGCSIQTLMDRTGCKWQDMLLGYYVEAGRCTLWPLTSQGAKNPLLLERRICNRTTAIMDLEKVISFLRPGVAEISARYGQGPATQLWSLLQSLKDARFDAEDYTNSLTNFAMDSEKDAIT